MFDPQRTMRLATGALTDADATWRAYLPQAGDWRRTAMLLTVPVVIAALLIAYLIGLVTGGGAVFGLRPTLLSTLGGIVLALAGLTISAFVLSALAGAFGGKNDFALGFAAISLIAVPAYVGQALSSLPWIGWLVSIVLSIYALVLLWRIIPLYLQVPNGKRAVHYILSLVVMAVIGIILSAVFARDQMAMQDSPFGGVTSSEEGSTAAAGGFFGGFAQRAEIVAAAQEDRYDPPGDGELEEAQVQEFARVMERYTEVVREQEARLNELSERAGQNERPSLSDIGAAVSSIGGLSALATAEMEIVKTSGGNWAEHQWVKQQLRTAWLQQDINDTVAHNYALYQRYEDVLRDHITQ